MRRTRRGRGTPGGVPWPFLQSSPAPSPRPSFESLRNKRREYTAGKPASRLSVAEGDPDQLVTAFLSYLDGITRMAVYNPEQFKKHFPDTEIILRIFKPSSSKPQPDNLSGQELEKGNDT